MVKIHNPQEALVRKNRRLAKHIWGDLPSSALLSLDELGRSGRFSIALGDITFLGTAWYVTHVGLIRLATRNHCVGIDVYSLPKLSDPASSRWAFKARVYKSNSCRGFVGFGDANPFNVSPLVTGAEMRVAETRAVNRALRKAYGVGVCSIEELGSSTSTRSANASRMTAQSTNGNGNYGSRNLRDRLCQLIRKHLLDASLVKSYAVDFCGTKTLREATREQVEAFVTHLSDWAEKDRNALLCQLNSYLPSPKKEVAPETDRAGAA